MPAAAITTLDEGRQWFRWALGNLPGLRKGAATLTAFKDNLISGQGVLSIPVAPAYSAPPTAGTTPIPPRGGVFALAGSVGTQIKSAIDYDPADGVALGLEGSDQELPDPATTAPDLSRSFLTSGGLAEIDWQRGPFAGIRLEVDRGDGKSFAYLATDTVPNYIDTAKPPAGTVAVYKYRAIYLLDDADYGQWSQTVEIAVRG